MLDLVNDSRVRDQAENVRDERLGHEMPGRLGDW
jgi:hypothetical protein